MVFWGAGATAALGMRTTAQQTDFILALAGLAKGSSIDLGSRVNRALGSRANGRQRDLLRDLLIILGDGADPAIGMHVVTSEQESAMAQNWAPGATIEDLRKRVVDLRLAYDWSALQDVLRICPGVGSDQFKINDLFNVLDMYAPFGHGFRAERGAFLDARRLLGAKAALKMLLHAMFYIDYQNCVGSPDSPLEKYEQFARWLGKRMQRAAASVTANFDRPEFIRGDVAFVSLNYDPLSLWTQFVANRELNADRSSTSGGGSSVPLHLFHDMGHFIPSRRVEPHSRPDLWYPMNEASAQRLNEESSGCSHKVRLSKFLFPHGCLCWRECPDCGKLSAYHGDEWSLRSTSLIPPPPLAGFETRCTYPDVANLNAADRAARMPEKRLWEEGVVDARTCLHCGTLTTTEHTQTVMQSSFKQPPPSFIDEIQRDLRALVMRADHVILMGYSLPPDDVIYRSFFAARRQRTDASHPVRCTVVGWQPSISGIIGPPNLGPGSFPEGTAVHSAREIFGADNVRFSGEGVPGAFCDATGGVSDSRLEELFTWNV